MYLPRHFAESDRARLHALMREHEFATLVTVVEGKPFATHLPLLLDPDRGEHGVLLGHMARANPQWRGFDGTAEALAIFAGPHAYVSPRLYATHPSVPTWNYAAVHAYGAPRLLEEEAARGLLARTVARFEGTGDGAWSMAGLPEEYVAGMLRGLVAFEIELARIEGKFKLSQNRPEEDRRRVAAALEGGRDPLGRGVAALMRAREEAEQG